MNLTDYDPKMAFKLGFLTRCAEEGLAGEELDMRVKQAGQIKEATLGQGAKDVITGAANLIKDVGFYGLGVPLAGGLLAGGLGGYSAAQLSAPPVNMDELKAEELAATYNAYANRIRSRRKALQYKPVR
jgi:hypothetical protein